MVARVTKVLGLTSLLLLIGITASFVWIGKIHLFDLPNYQTYVVNTYKGNQLVGHTFPVVPIRTVSGDTVATDFSTSKVGLVLLFDPFSCQPCLELVLKALQHMHDNLQDPVEVSIYAISNTALSQMSQYRRAFKLRYQLGIPVQGENMDHLFQRTPAVFLVDSCNRILQCHHPLYGKEQFTALYFEELIFNHLPAFNVDIAGFSDSPLMKLRGQTLLDVIRGRHAMDGAFRDL